MKAPTEDAWGALKDALATYFWLKEDLDGFLESHLGRKVVWEDSVVSKRDRVAAIVGQLRKDPSKNAQVVVQMLIALAELSDDFFALDGSDDPDLRKANARRAKQRVVSVVGDLDSAEAEEERKRIAARSDSDTAKRSRDDARKRLLAEFNELAGSTDPHGRGIALEELLRQLFELEGLSPRGAYQIVGEQMDGSLRLDGSEYLIESKWMKSPAGPEDANHFMAKVQNKAHTTHGLMISVNGFTQAAVERHSRHSTRLVFMDGADLHFVLDGRGGLSHFLVGA